MAKINAKFAQSDAYLSELMREVSAAPAHGALAMGRRTFVKIAGAAGAGLVLGFQLPGEAFAAMETIDGSIAVNPYRAGKPLDESFDGYHFARRGTYRIIYRIDEAKHQVEIHSIRHRRDAYRT